MRYVCALCIFACMMTDPVGAWAQKNGQPPPAEKGSVVRLQDTINATLRRSHSLKAIQENRVAVEEETRKAKAGWGPRVDVTARGGVNQLSNTTTRPLGDDTGFYGATSFGATLIQPLWDGFATRSRVRSSEATLDSMTSRVFDNATTLALDSIIAHIDVLRLRKILLLASNNVNRHKEILASARDRASMGADTVADVSQAEGRLSRALSSLEDARTKLLQGDATYRRLTGMPVPPELEPVSLPAPMFVNPDAVLAVVEKHNPKLEAYLHDIRAAKGQKELAESAYYPTVNLEAGPNHTNRAGNGEQWTTSLEVMGVLRWNVFNSGADVAGTRSAAAKERQARQNLYNLMDEIMLEVQTTWEGYQNALVQFKHYSDAIQYNTQTRDAYQEQFYTGQRTLLDVLDAESELFNSSTQAATAAGNILVGGYKLYGLTGTLLAHLGIDAAPLLKQPVGNDSAPIMRFK